MRPRTLEQAATILQPAKIAFYFFRLRKMGKVDSAKARHHKRKTEDNNLENKNLSYSAKGNRAKFWSGSSEMWCFTWMNANLLRFSWEKHYSLVLAYTEGNSNVYAAEDTKNAESKLYILYSLDIDALLCRPDCVSVCSLISKRENPLWSGSVLSLSLYSHVLSRLLLRGEMNPNCHAAYGGTKKIPSLWYPASWKISSNGCLGKTPQRKRIRS